MALLVTKQTLDAEVLKSQLPVVIDMFASWCGPCQLMSPIFDELSKELAQKYKLVKVNIDEERDIAIKFGVSSIPTFVFIKDGQVVSKATGYMSKDVLKNKIMTSFGV